MIRSLVVLMSALLIAISSNAALAQDPPKRAITQITGDLWRFQNNFHYSVFLVTPAGIIATDPINAEAATWLKKKLATQFQKDVKYVILSHDHADHSAGAEVFANAGAIVIAHERAKVQIIGERRPTAVPDITFKEQMTVELGGKSLELKYLGKNHSDNMIIMHFPAERALFAVDFIPVKTVAFKNFPDAYIPEWIDSLRKVEAMDFDILVPGHGRIGNRADVVAFREYMQFLHAKVLNALRLGKSLEATKAEIDLSHWRDWGQFEAWSPLNIEGMYERLGLNRRGN
ncbi:MAG: MBL fold metallo-hydrolase [Rhizobiales bacterium]|nr:MBL fold metallo-hydrolase [Hyphomicrobiales bacterium]